MWDIGEELKRFEALGLTDAEKELVLYKNACKLFKINEDKIIEKFKNK
jgi:predicted TIM-barrel fold metal-dependent hydrolase